MDELIDQIATNAADYQIGKYGQHLSKDKQIALWKRSYDSVFASLITFKELSQAHRTRALAHVSVN